MSVQSKIVRVPIGVIVAICGLIFIAIFAPILSNNKPLLMWDAYGLSFPVMEQNIKNHQTEHREVYLSLYPPIPYLPGDIDLDQTGKPPFTFPDNKPWYKAHWLGTDEIGRDVLAHLIYGCRSSVMIAVGAMAVALLIGLLLGALGGYWHERRLRLTIPVVILIVALSPVVFNGIGVAGVHSTTLTTVLIALLALAGFAVVIGSFHKFTEWFIKRIFRGKLKYARLPFYPDRWVMSLTNFFTTIPAYFALLAFLAIWTTPNAASISLALGLLMWPDIARLTRSAIIQLRQTGLAEAAESLGYSPMRVILIHLLPNALQPALVALGFGVAGAIMAESFLSFVGIAPAEMVSWGTLLAKTRSYPQMWWLSVFPGIAIFLAALIFYRLANALEKPVR